MFKSKTALCAMFGLLASVVISQSAAASTTQGNIVLTAENPFVSHGSYRPALENPDLTRKYYQFWETSFSNYVWVKSGTVFPNIEYVDAELSNRATMAFEFYDSSNRLIFSDLRKDATGWVTSYYGDYYDTPAKIKLVNKGSGTVYIKSGTVGYWE